MFSGRNRFPLFFLYGETLFTRGKKKPTQWNIPQNPKNQPPKPKNLPKQQQKTKPQTNKKTFNICLNRKRLCKTSKNIPRLGWGIFPQTFLVT